MAAMLTVRFDDLNALRSIPPALRQATQISPLMEIYGATLESSTRERFETNISPSGQRWKRSMGAAVRGTPTLVDRGRLRDSIGFAASASSTEVGTNVIYGGIHQAGGVITPKGGASLRFRLASGAFVSVKRVTMPKREFLGISSEDEAELDDRTAAWLAQFEGTQ